MILRFSENALTSKTRQCADYFYCGAPPNHWRVLMQKLTIASNVLRRDA